MIAGLLSGQRQDGGFGVHPYSKWTGWSLGKSNTEVVDWGDAHQIVTATALLVLQ